jgi:hypothetical protein
LGAGPFQRGDIYGGTQFAGNKLGFPLLYTEEEENSEPTEWVDYNKPAHFKPVAKPKKIAVAATPPADKGKPEPAASPPKPPEPSPAPKSEKPAQPAVADSKPSPDSSESPANPLESAVQLESGIRLRFHFDEPNPGQANPQKSGGTNLFRLDPVD